MTQPSDHFKNILIWALPASGKSEVMKFIRDLTPEQRAGLHIGDLVEIDDYPRVASMFAIDDEREAAGLKRVFTRRQDFNEGGFLDPKTWDACDYHLNFRYRELLAKNPKIHDDSTVMIECARGGPEGAQFPLPHGYEQTLRNLDDDILRRAVILYVQVTPEQARAKNDARYDPKDPNSTLAHHVPTNVMARDYSCDDVQFMMGVATSQGLSGRVIARSETYVPLAVLDNRADLTSFVRQNDLSAEVRAEKSAALYAALRTVLDPLHERYRHG